MTRSTRMSFRVGLIPAALFYASTASVDAADIPGALAKQQSYSTIPMSPSDRFVAGRYDKSGTYVPPHYQAAAKPPFHGYFFRKNTPGYDGLNSGATDKHHLDNDAGNQAGGRAAN